MAKSKSKLVPFSEPCPPPANHASPATLSVPLGELELRFFQWLDDSVAGAQLDRIKAFNVCLGEGVEYFEADFFGCPSYSKTDPDWACEWCHEGKERFVFASDEIEPEWEIGLRVARKLFKKYLAGNSPGAAAIRKVGIAAIGFSDGDLHVVLPAKKGRA